MLRDPVSSASHLLTAVWAVYATLILLRLTPGRTGRRVAVAVFGLSMVLLYLASGTFHAVPYTRASDPDAFRFFQKLDQSAIFVLIAGTNTPTLAIVLTGAWRRRMLILMWGFAAAGIGCLWLLPQAPHWTAVALYLTMGWLGLLPIVHYYRVLGWRAMNWVWIGATVYTAGAICELVEWPVIFDYPVRLGYHEILHFSDTLGTLAFFVFVTRYVIPYEPPADPETISRPRDESGPGLTRSGFLAHLQH